MKDLHYPCEHWAERISLAAAGCLSADEEREIRLHIEACSNCRDRFRQLTELCGALGEADLPTLGTESAIVERVMSMIVEQNKPTVASGESQLGPLSLWERARVRAAHVETIHRTLLTRSLTTWRWIMRSPASRVVAVTILVLVVTGVALWFHGGGTTPAFADFIQPILEAKTVKYKITTERTSLPAGMTGMMGLPEETQKNLMKASTAVVMMLDSNRSRTEWEMLGNSKMVQIWDGGQGKGLVLHPTEMRVTVSNITNMPKDKNPNGGDPMAFYRSLLLDARDKPDVTRESLGEKDIDGRQVVGFRISLPAMVMSLWGDPKTGLPVRIETTVAIMPNIKLTMSDFEFNVDMDESLFSLDVPAGYEVEVKDYTNDDSPSEEKELIETLRYYSEVSGGRFPVLVGLRKPVNGQSAPCGMANRVAATEAPPELRFA